MKKAFCSLLVLLFMLLCAFTVASAENPTILSDSLVPGDRFLMGYYEQDANIDNGREPIEWTVLKVDPASDTALVIASQALDCLQYHTAASGKVKWANCSLRIWLNYCFLYNAFNQYERQCLSVTSSSGASDYVTLLDENQIMAYHLAKTGCNVTKYAKLRGVEIGSDNGKGCWWVSMKVTGSNSLTKFVGIHGKVYTKNKVTIRNNGVRPAMTVSVSALQSCPRLPDIVATSTRELAFTNQKIATRSGPATTFDEIHTFKLPTGTPVYVLRRQVTNGTPWVEIEFIYDGKFLRVWTGEKRIERFDPTVLPGDYEVITTGTISSDTPGFYGPGYDYRTLYSTVPANTPVEILSYENGWSLVQYHLPDKLTLRAWIPSEYVW